MDESETIQKSWHTRQVEQRRDHSWQIKLIESTPAGEESKALLAGDVWWTG